MNDDLKAKVEAMAEAFATEQFNNSFFTGNTPEQDMELRHIWAKEFLIGAQAMYDLLTQSQGAEELHKAIAELGDFMPLNGLGNTFQPGTRAEKMQDALAKVYQLGFATYNRDQAKLAAEIERGNNFKEILRREQEMGDKARAENERLKVHATAAQVSIDALAAEVTRLKSQDLTHAVLGLLSAADVKLREENERLRGCLEYLRDNRVHDTRVTEIAREALKGTEAGGEDETI